MESDLAVDMLVSATTEKARISTIIMDQYSTTMVKIRKSQLHETTEKSGINHAKKSVGNDLYALQKKHHILSSKIIPYLQKYFSYTIKQHKNDPLLTRTTIQNIVPSCFGDHIKCDEKQCKGKFYEHKSLQYGKELCGEKFKKDLNQVFGKHVKNADALSPNGNTCSYESFNLVVASKAPKSIIIQNQRVSTFALSQRFAKITLARLT